MLGIGVGVPVSCVGGAGPGASVSNILLEQGGNLTLEQDGVLVLEG